MKRCPLVLISLACLFLWPASIHAIELVDGRAVFEEQLTGEVYNQRLKAALQDMPTVEELETSRTPTVGARINWINPGHQAEGLGIEPDTVLVSFDDRPLWPGWVGWGQRTRPQTLKFVTGNGESRSVTVQPGTIGINYSSHRRTDLAYIRRPGRLKTVDREVLVGMMMINSDPELAETAWAHAIAGGYAADDLSDTCAALIAMEQGRMGIANAVAKQVPPMDAEHAYRLHPNDRLRLSLASGRLEAIFDLPPGFLKEHKLDAEWQRELKERITAAGPIDVTPTQAAAGMKRRDLMGSVIPIDDPAIDSTNPLQFPGLMEGSGFAMSAWEGQYRRCYIGFQQPTEDIEVVVRYTIKADAGPWRWSPIFQIGLVDREYSRRHKIRTSQARSLNLRQRMIQMEVGVACAAISDTVIHLAFCNMPNDLSYFDPHYELAGPTEFEVRIVKVGEFIEAQLNGKTIALSPVLETTDQYGIIFQVVNARVKVHEFRVSALE